MYQLHVGMAWPMSTTYVWCDAGPRGAMHGQQLRQLVNTLMTLAVVCWHLTYQVVSAYHLISRHSGKMWGVFSS